MTGVDLAALPPGDPRGDAHDPGGEEALRTYVTQKHPEQFRPLWVTHPEGFTTVDGTPAPKVRVLVVEVVRGDVDAARRELERRYSGNLCVVGRPACRAWRIRRGSRPRWATRWVG